jgi:unsaturated rhamnogalacturonyl hydrolase
MFLRTQEPYYRETAVEYADWVLANAGRSQEGVFYHGASVSGEVWADTVFMALIFLSRTAKLTANVTMAEHVLKQLLSHLQLLQDMKTGILYHGYHCVGNHHMSGALWTRGNSWVVIGAPIIIETIHDLAEVPEEIFARYRRLVDGILKYQAGNGLWHTVMDRPDFYQETSGSAGNAAGILKAVRLQMLEPGIMASGLSHGRSGRNNQSQEAVEGVSRPPIMPTIDAQKLNAIRTLYGQGLTLRCSVNILQEKARTKTDQLA